MWIRGGGEEISLSAIRLNRMKVSQSGALDIKLSPQLIIGYLLRDKWKNLKSKFHSQMAM